MKLYCVMTDPPWFNNKIKSLIHEKNITFKRLRSDRHNSCLRRQLNCQNKNITVE